MSILRAVVIWNNLGSVLEPSFKFWKTSKIFDTVSEENSVLILTLVDLSLIIQNGRPSQNMRRTKNERNTSKLLYYYYYYYFFIIGVRAARGHATRDTLSPNELFVPFLSHRMSASLFDFSVCRQVTSQSKVLVSLVFLRVIYSYFFQFFWASNYIGRRPTNTTPLVNKIIPLGHVRKFNRYAFRGSSTSLERHSPKV